MMKIATSTGALLLLSAAGAAAFAPSLPSAAGARSRSPPRGLSMVVSDPSSTGGVVGEWSPSSWQTKPSGSGPGRPPAGSPFDDADPSALSAALRRLDRCAPLVFAGEVRSLRDRLARACRGQGFVLMGGDSAGGETFDGFRVDSVRDTFRVMLQMALVLTFGGGLPVIKVGRMAGQFVRPPPPPSSSSSSSSEGPPSGGVEVRDGLSLPAYRGDMINSASFDAESRRPDPANMVEAYHQSSQTLNILRAFSAGGYADISRLHAWNLDFAEETEEGSRYRHFAAKVDESLRFNRAIGIDTSDPLFQRTDFYTVHDCLCLPYEQALTRQDSITGKWYDCSAHLLVLDEQVSGLDSPHVEFVGGVHNPLALQITANTTPRSLLDAIEDLNPVNDPSRLSVVVHMSPESIRSQLPPLVRAVQRESKNVLWIADPGYGDVVEAEEGCLLSRDFEGIRAQLRAFFDVMDMTGAHPGGVSLDMTGDDVAELKGGVLCDRSEEGEGGEGVARGGCDPRLGGQQALELAFLIAERMRLRQGLPLIE